MNQRPAPGYYATHAMWAPDGALALTIALGPVPPRSPYQAGQWVRCHGYPGCIPGPQRYGWRGVVLGYQGSALLCGVTDDGAEWSENWGALVVDGAPGGSAVRCTCCPRSVRRARSGGAQLDLFTGAVAA